MTRTLVTILGRARRRDGDAGYDEATYRFPRGDTDKSAFFGLALARHLQPDEIVILGTASSMWSVLVENLASEGGEEHARIALTDAEEEGAVDQPLLDSLRPLMERATDTGVRPVLIPTGRDDREQYAILAVVNEVARDGNVDFDVTHGLRHLGMVGFLSSFMLERLRDLEVRGLWYGALDMRGEDGIAPVLRLDGLLRVRRWLEALAKFEATGNYGVFGQLLKEDGLPEDKVRCLEEAAFLERTLNVRDAARKLQTFLPELDEVLSGASDLFQRHLQLRLDWARAATLSERQRLLALQYLSREDYVRAAALGREACVSRLFEENNVETGEYYSDDLQEELKELSDQLSGVRRRSYFALRAMRNALAHGARPKRRDVENALKDRLVLARQLRAALNGFFG